MGYSAEVLADSPRFYWRLDAASGNESNQGVGGAMSMVPNVTNPPIQNIAPNASWTDLDGKCWQFDGTNDAAATSDTVDLSAYSIITVEFLLYWNAFANDDDMAMEFSVNANATNGGFWVDPNMGGAPNQFQMLQRRGDGTGTPNTVGYFSRPSGAAWHHYALVFNLTTPTLKAYVDGVAQAVTITATGSGGSVFGNRSLYLMNRNNASLFGAGKIDELAIYGSELSSARVTAHYTALGGTQTPPYANVTVAMDYA